MGIPDFHSRISIPSFFFSLNSRGYPEFPLLTLAHLWPCPELSQEEKSLGWSRAWAGWGCHGYCHHGAVVMVTLPWMGGKEEGKGKDSPLSSCWKGFWGISHSVRVSNLDFIPSKFLLDFFFFRNSSSSGVYSPLNSSGRGFLGIPHSGVDITRCQISALSVTLLIYDPSNRGEIWQLGTAGNSCSSSGELQTPPLQLGEAFGEISGWERPSSAGAGAGRGAGRGREASGSVPAPAAGSVPWELAGILLG